MKRLAWLVPALAASMLACKAEDTGSNCAAGSETCECYANRSCDTGLICSGSGICVEDEEGSGGSGDSGGSGGSGGSGDSGGSGGSGDSGGSSSAGGSSGAGGSASGGSATNDSGGASSTTDAATDSGGSSSTSDGGAGGATSTSGANGGMGGASGATTTEATATTTSGGGTSGETRTAITPIDGWVDGSTNDVGIQGGWYTFADDISTIVPGTEPYFEGAGSALCVSGTVLPHENLDLSWGVAVGMDLYAVDEVANPYDAAANGVAGFQFTVSGTLPPRLQVNVTSPADGTYCRRYESIASSQETLSVYFSSMEENCWEVGAENAAPDPTQLEGFHIQVISSATESVSFDFCVEDISALLL